MTDPASLPELTIRGFKTPNPYISKLFIFLGTLDLTIQYLLLSQLYTNPLGPTIMLGLPLKSLILLFMATGTVLKQNYRITYMWEEKIPIHEVLVVSGVNFILNCMTGALSLVCMSMRSYYTPALSSTVLVGMFFYLLGMFLEVLSEVQRRDFEREEKNEGKAYMGGLFGLARHINYGGYILMRTGYTLAAGGWVFGGMVGGAFFYDFATRVVPFTDLSCAGRCGEQWIEFKMNVPYKLFPGIY